MDAMHHSWSAQLGRRATLTIWIAALAAALAGVIAAGDWPRAEHTAAPTADPALRTGTGPANADKPFDVSLRVLPDELPPTSPP
jgi:hypothetical protein